MSAARWLVPSLVGAGAIALAVQTGRGGSANAAWSHDRIPMPAGYNARGVLKDGQMTFTVYRGLTAKKVTETLRTPWQYEAIRASTDSTLRYLVQRAIERGAPYPERAGSANDGIAQLRTALHAARAPEGSMERTSTKRRKVDDPLAAVADAFLRVDVRETSDTDLVAVLLAGTTSDDPIRAASDLLRDVGGNLARVARAEGLIDRPGFGSMARASMVAAAELARRAQLKGAVEGMGASITGPRDAVALARAYAQGPQERVVGLYFDKQLRVIASRTLHVGAVDMSLIDVREVMVTAIETRANSFILVHNHPSGRGEPSPADDTTTRRVAEAAKALSLQFLDHLVLGREGVTYSYAEQRPHLLS
jgi:DNA repair protein RadC